MMARRGKYHNSWPNFSGDWYSARSLASNGNKYVPSKQEGFWTIYNHETMWFYQEVFNDVWDKYVNFLGGKPGSHRTIWTTFVHGYVSPASSTCTPCCEMMELGDTFDGGISFLSNLIYLGDESILISIWMISIWWDIQYLILIWSIWISLRIHPLFCCVRVVVFNGLPGIKHVQLRCYPMDHIGPW